VPPFLLRSHLVLDLSLIVAGTKYRGQFEERLKTIMKEIDGEPELDRVHRRLHTLVGAGSAEGSLDAANILKPALSRGENPMHWRDDAGRVTASLLKKTAPRAAVFQAVKVARRPRTSNPVREGVRERYEKFHAVSLHGRKPSATRLSVEPLHSRPFLPDKALTWSTKPAPRQVAPGHPARRSGPKCRSA